MGSLSRIQGLFPTLPNSGIEPRSPGMQADSLPAEPQAKPKNTGVGSLSLLQRIFLTQESNWILCLAQCKLAIINTYITSLPSLHPTCLGHHRVPDWDPCVGKSWEEPLDSGKATHSSILAWRIPGLYSSWGCKESDMTEQLSLSAEINTILKSNFPPVKK